MMYLFYYPPWESAFGSFFIRLLNMSITASYLAMAVMLLRLIFKKAPRWMIVALWAMVGLRLILPFSIESILSLIPSTQSIPETILVDTTPHIDTGVAFVNSSMNPILEETMTPAPGDSVNPMQVWGHVIQVIWLLGVGVMALYTAGSYLRIKRNVKEAVKLEGRIYQCDHIPSPFILGIIVPRIYLPSSMAEADIPYVIAHEKAHLKRLDHIWKPLGFILLTVHWFNPVLWIAYILLCRDIEIACDEKVISQQGPDIKKAYSQALLNCSISRRSIAACPLAFGETCVKGRIKGVLNYKKPAFWVVLVALIASIVAGVCFLTDPVKDKSVSPAETTVPGSSENHPAKDNSGLSSENTVPGSPGIQTNSYAHWFTREDGSATINAPDIILPEFPEITIQALGSTIRIVDEGGYTDVISGWPLENAFFCDVTGDGKRDICATVSFGSGMIDQHIEIYDIAHRQRTSICNRGETDYRLSMKDSSLWVQQRAYEPGLQGSYAFAFPLTKEAIENCTWESVRAYSLLGYPIYNSINQHSAWERFPEYLNMNVENGLTIYIWEAARGTYGCVPVPGKNHELSTVELMRICQMPHMTLEETRAILTTYGLSGSRIRVAVIQVPNSSYIGRTDDAFVQELRKELGLNS